MPFYLKFRKQLNSFNLFLFFYAFFAFYITIKAGPLFDYENFYANVWQLTLDGNNPWTDNPENLYPPLFFAFSLFYFIHPLLPKLLFSASAIFTIFSLFKMGAKNLFFTKYEKIVALLLLFFNSYFYIFVYYYGCADIFVALLVFASLRAMNFRSPSLSAVFLGLATMVKIYPAFIITVFLFDREKKQIQWRWLFTYILTIFCVLIVAFLFWGTSFLESLKYSLNYEPELLSITAHIHWVHPWLELGMDKWIGVKNSFFAIVFFCSWATICLLSYYLKLEKHVAAFCIMAVSLAAYRVAHVQYMIIVLVLGYYALLFSRKNWEEMKRSPLLLFYYLWLQVVFVWYAGTVQGIFLINISREYVGLPHFLGAVALVADFYRRKNLRYH